MCVAENEEFETDSNESSGTDSDMDGDTVEDIKKLTFRNHSTTLIRSVFTIVIVLRNN